MCLILCLQQCYLQSCLFFCFLGRLHDFLSFLLPFAVFVENALVQVGRCDNCSGDRFAPTTTSVASLLLASLPSRVLATLFRHLRKVGTPNFAKNWGKLLEIGSCILKLPWQLSGMTYLTANNYRLVFSAQAVPQGTQAISVQGYNSGVTVTFI